MIEYFKNLSAVLLHDNPLTSYILLILLVAFAELCQAENHHCSPLGQHVLPLDNRMNKDETLIPELQDADSVKRFDYNRCRWRFEKNSRPQTGVQLVVQGLPLATEFSRCVNKAEIQIKSSLGWKKKIEAGSIHVFSLFKRQSLDIEAYWKANTPAVDRCAMKVRVLVPIQQDCSPDMLGFRGNCFALSTQKQNLTDAMSNIGGDAQLASFSSMAEISEFIAASE
uniref:CUB domain-containing protein n=1 Tax=Macrostomum lignano TaxID=282301 RepID=A0A1I8J522_9PLAT